MSTCHALVALVFVVIASLASAADDKVAEDRAAREAALAQMLSGATLEGSFTITGRDLGKLSPEKYTLGTVRKVDSKKLDGNNWLFPTRIEYGDRDLTVPLTLPIEWAGDTPVVVVDNIGIPGLGAVSARVLFFADHYAGYWQHGEASGNLFGAIHRADAAAAAGSSD